LSTDSPFDLAEYQMLKQFYEAWEHLHSLPNDRLHRRQAEEAAEALVGHAHVLRRMNVKIALPH
jgi:hypothetical protein